MITFLIIIHVVICVALIFIVLIQTGKGGLDSNFGGVATNMLGSAGANEFIKTWTKILFAAFVVSCVLLAIQVKRAGGGVSTTDQSGLVQEAQEGLESFPTSDSETLQIDFPPMQSESID